MTVIAYLATPIDAHYLRTLLIGLDAVVSVNDDGVLVIETPDTPMRVNRRGVAARAFIADEPFGSNVTTTAKAAFGAFKDWESPEDQQYDEDEEMFYGAAHACALCGHHARFLGGSVTEPGQATMHLCHGCDEDHDCYRRWTVHGVRPHTDWCRDLYCGGCEEADPPHLDPCDCDDCRSQPTLEPQPDTPTEPPVGAVARCTGCGNVFLHRRDGWLDTDDLIFPLMWSSLHAPSCGPIKVIYGPGEDA